jgi:hypothetical protein
MAYIVDKETRLFWKDHGEGLTDKEGLAGVYSDAAAHSLLRLFCDEVFLMVLDPESTTWKEIFWQTDTRSMPLRTKLMRDKELVWVAYDGLWMATDRQALVLGTLLALNTPTAFKKEPIA